MSADFKSEKLTNTGGVFQAAISPDGKRMVYSSEVNTKQSVWVRQFDTSENIQILTASDEVYFGLGFSHDGQKLFLARGKQSGTITIYHVSVFGDIPKEVTNGDGTNQRQLTNSQGANWKPIVSPNRLYIYFASNRSGSIQVWRMNADGSNQTQMSMMKAATLFLLHLTEILFIIKLLSASI